MTTHPPYLSAVDDAGVERLEAGITALADGDVAVVPVVDLPQRPDVPKGSADVPSDHQTFIARVTADTNAAGTATCFDIAGVTSWREHEGRLDLYGPVAAGQVTRIASVAPLAWASVERLDRAGRAR